MWFITKRKVRNMILAVLNESTGAYNSLIKDNVTEQRKRDAFMIQSGQTTMALNILTKLEGRRKNGKSKRSSKKQHSKKANSKKAVG